MRKSAFPAVSKCSTTVVSSNPQSETVLSDRMEVLTTNKWIELTHKRTQSPVAWITYAATYSVTTTLVIVYIQCLSSSTHPNVWKEAEIILLPKSLNGPNSRPISAHRLLTTVIEKMLFNAIDGLLL